MLVKVRKHDIEIIQDERINENEVNISECNFEFSEDYDAYPNLVKKAIFIDEKTNNSYEILINNDKCNYPSEILKNEGFYLLGVYAYEVKDNNLVLRFSPEPCYFNVVEGSYREHSENSKPITPSEMEQYQQNLQNSLNDVNNKLSEVVKSGNYAKEQGDNAKSVVDEINQKLGNGEFNGPTGKTPNIQVGNVTTLPPGENANVTITGTIDNPILNMSIPQGEKGETGETGPQGLPGERGEDGNSGPAGDNYVITDDDYEAIAQKVAAIFDEKIGLVNELLDSINGEVI